MTKKKVKKKTKHSKKLSSKTPARGKKSVKNAIGVGDQVPKLELQATGDQIISVPEEGVRTVIFFYPKDSTPGCTIESRDFSRLHNEFTNLGVKVYGLSRDNLKSHARFKEKEALCFDLLSDANEEACEIFGVMKLKNMYGKKVRGIERSTFVVGSDGKIEMEWRGVSVPGHAEEVLGYVRGHI